MTTNDTTGGVLRGVRVAEFGQYIPGPLLAMLLAEQGADVIKIERPGGDPARAEPAFATWNRNKRSVELDLKSPAGRRQAQDLAHWADVLIENFRPGVADRLGIGYAAATQANPGLIYCSLPGFGPDSPHRQERGWEPIVVAAAGGHQGVAGMDEPLFLPLPAASTFAAVIGAVSVAMALVARQRTGRGQRIEVPLHSAMFAAMGRHLSRFHHINPPDLFQLPRSVMSQQYQCADGRYVQNHGMYQRFASQFLQAAGKPEWIEDLEDLYGAEVRPETIALWRERIANLFRQKTAKEWEDAIAATGGACAVCNTIEEWLVHPHAQAAGMVVEVDDATHGPMKQPGPPVRLRGVPGPAPIRAPNLGEHTASALSETARPPSPPANAQRASTNTERNPDHPELVEGRPPENILSALQGIRVLDLCIVLAGPTCGRTLGEFGADVIKIDDPSRPYDYAGNLDVNRGKRSIRIDLKQESGRQVFWKLLESADVVVENYRKGSLARLGLGYDEVRKRRPDLIYASLNAFGYDGPWAGRPGWEQLAQAATGIQTRRGGRDAAPQLLPYPMNDYATGLLGAYSVALALNERQRTGRGQQVDGGLALTAGLLQSPYFLDFNGHQRAEPEGLDLRGHSALSRLYQAADGWLCLHCPDAAAWDELTRLPDFASLADDARFGDAPSRRQNDAALCAALSPILSASPRRHWINLLQPTAVSIIENLDIPDFHNAPHIRQAGLVASREHPGMGLADHLGIIPQLSATPVRLGRPTPVLGAETDEILAETGYTATEIAALKAAGAVAAT